MNWEKGFRRIALLAGLIGALCCAGLGILLTLEYGQKSTRFYPRPLTLDQMAETPRANMREVPGGYCVYRWPRKELVGWCVVSGVGGGVIGFCAVWGIYRLFKWVVLGFVSNAPKNKDSGQRG